jgi:hypothetical protein
MSWLRQDKITKRLALATGAPLPAVGPMPLPSRLAR